MSQAVDRHAAIRRALRDLVAERRFRGASMGAVAEWAGVATGTAQVHYDSKDELVYATQLAIKADLGVAMRDEFDPSDPLFERRRHILTTAYRHLSEQPERARFLTQLEESPYYEEAHTWRAVTKP